MALHATPLVQPVSGAGVVVFHERGRGNTTGARGLQSETLSDWREENEGRGGGGVQRGELGQLRGLGEVGGGGAN